MDRLYRETSPLLNALTVPDTHRCHGKVLSPNTDYSYPPAFKRALPHHLDKSHTIKDSFFPRAMCSLNRRWVMDWIIEMTTRMFSIPVDFRLSDLVFYLWMSAAGAAVLLRSWNGVWKHPWSLQVCFEWKILEYKDVTKGSSQQKQQQIGAGY